MSASSDDGDSCQRCANLAANAKLALEQARQVTVTNYRLIDLKQENALLMLSNEQSTAVLNDLQTGVQKLKEEREQQKLQLRETQEAFNKLRNELAAISEVKTAEKPSIEDDIGLLKTAKEQLRAALVEARAKRLETTQKYQKTATLLKDEMERREKLENFVKKTKQEIKDTNQQIYGIPTLVRAVKDLVEHLEGSEASATVQRRVKKVTSQLKAIQAQEHPGSTSDEDEALLVRPKRREAIRPEGITEERPIEELMDALTTLTSAGGLEPAR
ncbi:hypothetical protein L596_025477 [Steinernema carpocapsae]|uniref:Uncharacterized protein n=1 Tax=Steinernema carpocapsae TaxID=34508 RepID=A0A4U5M8Q1_STECR|nr:hypothetical protein L596_025477 [Steinernema carpocapsae]